MRTKEALMTLPHHFLSHLMSKFTHSKSDYQRLLSQNGMLPSMGQEGECHDNGIAESFFGTLKTKLVDDKDYQTREQAKQRLFEYIEVFYNRQRRHSYLDYVNPNEYERVD